MPILVACDCGKRFAARDHLFGRQVSCPACGGSFTVSTAGRHSIGGLFVTCTCGLAFHADESLRGRQARCRGCGEILLVGGPDPLGLASSAGLPSIDVLAAPLPILSAPPDEYEIPWAALKRIGFYGGILLIAVIIVTTIIQLVTPLLRGP